MAPRGFESLPLCFPAEAHSSSGVSSLPKIDASLPEAAQRGDPGRGRTSAHHPHRRASRHHLALAFATRHDVRKTERGAHVSATDEPISFEQHIKPLFRERDRETMKWAFDLWSHDDVAGNSDAILGRLRDGTMPCDGAWPDEQVAVFQGGSRRERPPKGALPAEGRRGEMLRRLRPGDRGERTPLAGLGASRVVRRLRANAKNQIPIRIKSSSVASSQGAGRADPIASAAAAPNSNATASGR